MDAREDSACGFTPLQQTINFIEAEGLVQTPQITTSRDQCYPWRESLAPNLMILDVLHRIANHHQSLSRTEAHAVMTEVLTGQCSDAQIAALLVALHMKGETVEEIVGFAEAIR